jgi:hypothetical protein
VAGSVEGAVGMVPPQVAWSVGVIFATSHGPKVIVGFCLYGVVVLLAILAAYAFVKLYVDSYEENKLLSLVR